MKSCACGEGARVRGQLGFHTGGKPPGRARLWPALLSYALISLQQGHVSKVKQFSTSKYTISFLFFYLFYHLEGNIAFTWIFALNTSQFFSLIKHNAHF